MTRPCPSPSQARDVYERGHHQGRVIALCWRCYHFQKTNPHRVHARALHHPSCIAATPPDPRGCRHLPHLHGPRGLASGGPIKHLDFSVTC
eukprot:898765-Pyramimonas_sp.AAC.1